MRIPVWLGVALALTAQAPLYAQSRATTADVTGTVRDTSGAMVPGADVSVVDADTNLERTTVSGLDGRFEVPALVPGRYRMRVSLAGFATQVFEDLDIPLGSRLHVGVELTIAATEERVVVLAGAPALDTERTAISTVVSQSQIDQLPLNGRDFMSLSLITPAVTVDRVPQQGAAAGSGLNFVGQRARSNNITVDGLDNNEPTTGSVRATFSQEAIQEFQVVAHSYAAEFGKATGGVVNIVTRSGTNTTAGSAFVYARDEAINASEHFERFNPDGSRRDVSKAPFSQQQFGAALGGPIRRDRVFYFAALERLATKANNFVTIDNTLVGLLQQAGFPVKAGYVPYRVRSDSVVVKADRRFDAGGTFTLRYNFAGGHNGNIEPFGGIVAESRGGAIDSTDHTFAAAYTSVHGGVVNELRAQIARRKQGVFPLDPTCSGACDRDDEGGPTVEIAGVANAGRHRIYPQLRDYVRYQALDTVSRVRGAHELKAGFDFGWQQGGTTTIPLHYGGRFIFGPLAAVPGLLPTPVTATQAFALGLPSAYVQGYGRPDTRYNTGDLSLFVQDVWRLRPNVTAKVGVRYQTQFWPETVFDVAGIGRYGFPSDRDDIAPRFAVSWNPGRGRQTTVHGAYGLFFERQISAVASASRIANGGSGTRTLALRFPQSLAAWQAPGRRLPEPTTPYPSLAVSIDPEMKTPYAHHASVGVDRLLPGGLALSANVVRVRGFNHLGTIDYNPIVTSLGARRRPLDVAGVPDTSASVLQYTSFGESWYRGLLLLLEKRFDRRYQLLASYTLSKTEDTSADFQTSVITQTNGRGRDPSDPLGLPLGFDPLADKGAALHDQRHQLVLSGSYAAPGRVLLSAIFTAASGAPFSALAGVDLNGDGDGGSFPTDRARRAPADPSTSRPRNSERLPSQVSLDVRANRAVSLAGRRQIEVLVEAFNLFNRSNFTEVNNIFGTGAFPDHPLPTYGQFLRAGPPRQVQVGVRLRF